MTDDEPIIEITCGTIRWRVWADGRLSGFPGGARITTRNFDLVDRQRAISDGAKRANEKYEEWQARVNRQR